MAYANKIDSTVGKTLPQMLQSRAQICPDLVLQSAKDTQGKFQNWSYKEVYQSILQLAAEFSKIGITKGDRVAIISDNRREWLLADFAILSLGATDVPRGCDSTSAEISFIISFAGCRYAILENNRQLEKIIEKKDEIPDLQTVFLFDEPEEESVSKAKSLGITVYLFETIVEQSKKTDEQAINKVISTINSTSGDEIATIIFTSGTTGVPKGVMLSHDNYIAQMEVVANVLPVKNGEMWLTVLPVWHSFERALEYMAIALNSGLAYSKPVAPIMLADFAAVKPQWMCGVPRLWESLAQGVYRSMRKAGKTKNGIFTFFINIGKKYSWAKEHLTGSVCRFAYRYRFLDACAALIPFILLTPLYKLGDILVYKKIREKLGGKLVAVISGGGALPPETDAFYRAIGIKLLEGYGITEAAPVLSVREINHIRPGCVGAVYPSAEMKVVAEENGVILSNEPLAPGKKGLILARGRQIMKGYYKREDLTSQVIDSEGWLNTGDLGIMTYDNEIKITGRAKDTIVLFSGENVEPLGIENTLCGSPYIETAVVLGQDMKYLGALLVPSRDAVLNYAKENNVVYSNYESLLETGEVLNLIRTEIDNRINANNGFRSCELVYKFVLTPESFAVGRELSGKQELMRHKIIKIYEEQISTLF